MVSKGIKTKKTEMHLFFKISPFIQSPDCGTDFSIPSRCEVHIGHFVTASSRTREVSKLGVMPSNETFHDKSHEKPHFPQLENEKSHFM